MPLSGFRSADKVRASNSLSSCILTRFLGSDRLFVSLLLVFYGLETDLSNSFRICSGLWLLDVNKEDIMQECGFDIIPCMF